MTTITKELQDASFDAIHGIVHDYLIEKYGECDHDKHGEILEEFTELYEILLEDTKCIENPSNDLRDCLEAMQEFINNKVGLLFITTELYDIIKELNKI